MRVGYLLTLGMLVGHMALQGQERPDSARQAEIAARMMELALPGPEHQRLAALAGTWDLEVRFNAGDGAPPMTITAVAQNRMILGGRFLTSEVSGGAGGMPFGSLTILGFDRAPEKYTSVGFDTFGTYYVTAAGGYDEATKTITLSGTVNDQVTGHHHDYEFMLTLEGPDAFTWTIVFLEEGRRNTVAELRYKRR